MEHPVWTSDLAVGLHAIDSQHKQLFTLSRALHEAILDGKGNVAVKETFDALEDYVKRHFSKEEDYMRSIGYPDIREHIAQHEQLRLRCRMLWELDKRNKHIDPEGVAFFLKEWICGHILTSDKAIGEFARTLE